MTATARETQVRKARDAAAVSSIPTERLALLFRVPYWLIEDQPRPSWLRRPVWRFRASWWRFVA